MLLIIGVYYIYYNKNDEFEHNDYSEIIVSLKGILEKDGVDITNNQEVVLSSSQLTDGIIEILNNDIEEINNRLVQENNDEYSLDDRFTDMNVLAMKYEGLANWDKVGEIYLQILENYQDNSLAWHNLASYQIKAGLWESARNNLYRSLEINNQFIPAWSQLIDLYKYKVKVDSKIMTDLYKLALSYTNNDNTLLRGYAEYLEQHELYQLAMSVWKQAYEESYENRDVILNRINKLQDKIDN